MIKIAILGANGYIGQHLAHFLLKQNQYKVYLFDIQESSLVDDSVYDQLDLSQSISQEIIGKLKEVNYIYFFSGLTGTYASVDRSELFINVNEIGLIRVLDLFKEMDVKPKIIFPSTRLIYKGKKQSLLKESDEKEFKTTYSVNKFACENYLQIYKRLYNLNYTIFRICVPYGNVIGSNLSYGTLGHFINKAKAGQNISIYGDGSLMRTFTHVEDLVAILINAGLNHNFDNDVFNIGSKDHLTLGSVATKIAEIYNVGVDYLDFPQSDLLIESGDTIFDDAKLKSLIDFEYKFTFDSWIGSITK